MQRVLLVVAAVCSFFGAAQNGRAQNEPQPTFKVKSHIVLLPVTVRNSKNELMQSLTRDDFALFEDGQPQKIRYFDLEKDRPLTLGLLVDMSGSVRDFVAKEHEASNVFFQEMLRKQGDTAFLVRFDTAVTMLQPPTESRDKLRVGVERLEEAHEPQRAFRDPTGESIKGKEAPGTLLYDAIVVVSNMVSKQLSGRKALVILSDGEDWGSQKSLAAAIEAAQQADTVIYTILYTNRGGVKDPPHFAGAPHLAFNKNTKLNGANVLELLSTTTGGHAYEVSKATPLEAIYANIAEEMRMQYTLAYTPARSNAKPGYRKILLKTKDKSLQIQTRFGYYSKE
ncbi:MAG TPA: VWA domain-containing protein [Acidobacteriaceae bacterium]